MSKPDTTTRRVIQITSCGVQENGSTQCEMFIHALCDDGTVWRTDNRSEEWTKLPSIPADELSDDHPF